MEFELQKQILKAKQRLAQDESLSKNVRKKHAADHSEARAKVRSRTFVHVCMMRLFVVCFCRAVCYCFCYNNLVSMWLNMYTSGNEEYYRTVFFVVRHLSFGKPTIPLKSISNVWVTYPGFLWPFLNSCDLLTFQRIKAKYESFLTIVWNSETNRFFVLRWNSWKTWSRS